MTTIQFQQGVGGYAGTADTYLRQASPTARNAGATTLNVDSSDGGGAVQALIRFDGIFGGGPGQVPPGAEIVSAKLELETTGKGDGAGLHRMLRSWSDADTWASLGSGVQADDAEAAVAADLVTGFVPTGATALDVTASVQAWANGQPNHGWVFRPLGPDGWDFYSAEGATPPKLIVGYGITGDPVNNPPVAGADSSATPQGTAVAISVLANDTDPDGDALTVTDVTDPANGTVAVNPDQTITYTPDPAFVGEDSFTYRAWDGSRQSEPATVSVTVSAADQPPPLPLESSYIATTVSTGDRRNMEHTNATKSFYHDGDWWAVLPNQTNWYVHRFDGPLPKPDTLGGWTKTSAELLASGRRADIAWHDPSDTLYVVNFGPGVSKPYLFKLGYDTATRTFGIEAKIQLAGTGGKLKGNEWSSNTEMALGLDQHGNPLVSVIGPSPSSGGERGLKVAYPTTNDLSVWASITVDPGPTTTGGDNGNNKADFVSFRKGGIDRVGLAYGDDATGTWKFAYHDSLATPAGYGSGWTIGTVTNTVAVDNHIAALWDGSAIFITMKDDKDAIWAVKGMPGAWDTPVKVHNGRLEIDVSYKASRPTLALDEDNDQIFFFYQESVSKPTGDIHYKASDTGTLSFDPTDPGIRILASSDPNENMIDPQMPTHPVGAATDGKFLVFARNDNAPEVWYNDIVLSDTYQLIG